MNKNQAVLYCETRGVGSVQASEGEPRGSRLDGQSNSSDAPERQVQAS
jgi:hypothetical protein